MGKKNKLGISTLVERVEQLVNDALKRIDTLQNQVNDLREQVMERAGLADKSAEKSKRSTTPTRKAGSSGTSTKSSGTATKASGTGQKASQTAKTAGNQTKSELTRIKGIGPATAKKMQAKGITTIKQLANPSADDQKKLEEFRKLKNFSSWQAEARKLN